jgi:hypothetical protein
MFVTFKNKKNIIQHNKKKRSTNMNNNILIIQASPSFTGSTILVNILYGLIPSLHHRFISYETPKNNQIIEIIKTNNINIDQHINKYKKFYKYIYFVCSEKDENKFNLKYKNYNNILIFNFNELNETEEQPLENIINNVHDKLLNMIKINLNKQLCINRINNMKLFYENIKEKPFSYIEPFYHIHGSFSNINII